ncbi:MAG: protein kinase [Hormoscilla sp. SP5CHS1]|nr:protein kinase [Hormoscilla sp. SP5CHS1]
MIALILLNEQQSELQRWSFPSETIGPRTARKIVKIGRSPDNDIVLTNNMVSRYHLELRQITNADVITWQLFNQGTNGTFLNGVGVEEAMVFDGALIQLAQGGPVLKFQASSSVPTALLSACAGAKNRDAPASISSACDHAGNLPDNLFCIHCGQPLKVEQVIRQYQVLRTLGRGGMGTTYLAWYPDFSGRPRTDRVAAAQPHRSGNRTRPTSLFVLKEMNADMAQIEKARELFTREADTLKKLDHPGIPQFFDSFIDRDKKYLAMELIHGQDLEKRVFHQGPCTLEQAVDWTIQTCDILSYLHSQDPPILHRDIKPGNLLLRRLDNRIFLIDFGAVKEIGTPQGTRIGAQDYSPREQNLGLPVIQSDLYAIGPTLIFLLTSDSPHKYYRRPQKNHPYRFHLPEKHPTITPQLRFVIEKVTAPKPRDRFQTAAELKHALANC